MSPRKTLISTANVETDVVSLHNGSSLTTKEHRRQKKTAPGGSPELRVQSRSRLGPAESATHLEFRTFRKLLNSRSEHTFPRTLPSWVSLYPFGMHRSTLTLRGKKQLTEQILSNMTQLLYFFRHVATKLVSPRQIA